MTRAVGELRERRESIVFFGRVLLEETDYDVQQDDEGDYAAFDPGLDAKRDCHGLHCEPQG